MHFRKIIAKIFGRSDFVTLINTHEHGDHTTGNYIYSDCEIIAHETCAEGMQSSQGDLQRIISWYKEYIPKQEKKLAGTKKGSDEYKKLNERLIVDKMALKTMKKGFKLTLPTKTFKDKMKLDMGNMTLELFYMGGLHTASDIFIMVPEEGLLFTGDVMADTWYTDTPGCLQSFGGRTGIKRDLPMMLSNWKSLIARKDEIKDYIPGHWNGDLSYEGFVDRYKYLVTLKKEVKKAAAGGGKLETLLHDLDLNTRFPKLAGKPGFTIGFVHNNNVLTLWSEVTGAQSASNALSKMIEEKGLKEAVSQFKSDYQNRSKSNKYYYLEQDFNSLGYRYLNQKKYDEAITVFKLNVKIHPDSWNVYDSLGEACLNAGKKEMAMKSYKKALEMNPQKTDGQKKQHAAQIKILNELKKGE
jgi:glyoxylase-like metal-dependent hydrolase (beta-lactamase superfamily II)